MGRHGEVKPDDYRSSYRLPDQLYRDVSRKASRRLEEAGGRKMSMNDAIQEALQNWVDEGATLRRLSDLMSKYQETFESIAQQLDALPPEVSDSVADALMELVASVAAALASLPADERERAIRSMAAVVRVSVDMYQQYSRPQENPRKRKHIG